MSRAERDPFPRIEEIPDEGYAKRDTSLFDFRGRSLGGASRGGPARLLE